MLINGLTIYFSSLTVCDVNQFLCKPYKSIKAYFPSLRHGPFLSYLCVIFAEEMITIRN